MWRDVRAVLFDLDGTLLDSAPDLGAAAQHLRASQGLAPLPLIRYRAHAGSGARGMLRVAFGITPEAEGYEALRQAFFDAYEVRMLDATRPFGGVDELLARLAESGRGMGVVTNKSERFALPIARALPVFERMQAFVCGDTTPHAKPHPAPLLEAARRMGVEARDCVYVGDDERDIQAGRAAGMRTVAARYGYLGSEANVASWNADAAIDSPLQLLKLFNLP
ncbi:MAG: HAD-IA family hydrolase [Hydrogenophaga sp.]|uniref:HAD family hydrolase n=1 Tax=Hydrogenophaga sp. TaxID=1904254 RepID=UPI001E181C5B|nr:HAD-IA family hydrolase [Hydrogenophaga sp.]MBX3610906.1 HAD-IA family hydrolase [Hydrogenophaga sp.]